MKHIIYILIVGINFLSPAVIAQTSILEDSRPLFFDVDQFVKISPPHLTYDLQSSQGEVADFGNGIIFNDDSLKAALENNELRIFWDKDLVPFGELSIITELGQEIWKVQLNTQGTWTFKDLKGPEAPRWNNGDKFHFCLRYNEGNEYSNLCTASYTIIFSENNIEMGRTKSDAAPRVIIDNEERALKGDYEVKKESPTQFLVTLKSNASYDFLSLPPTLVIKDMVKSKEQGLLTLTGEKPLPLHRESTFIEGEKYGKLTRTLGFEKTIAEVKDLWQTTVSEKGTVLAFPCKAGGFFVYNIEVLNPPDDSQRLFLTTKTVSSTYLNHTEFVLVDAQGNPVPVAYDVPEKWATNKVIHDRSYLDIYRGSAREASLRLTGVASSEGNFVVMGEGHLSWWFEDLFGWKNENFSQQRWGASAKYFTSLTDFPVSNGNGNTEDVRLSALQADVRYRLTPGLWERDETVGLIAAYETVSLGSDNIPKLGAGLFWARSMPRSINTWFSKLPFMNYPKWVDMELITFINSPNSDVKLKNDFIVNFHGKVLWTSAFFGEAGFGIKNYHYEYQSNGYGAILTTYYGTLGLGLNF